MAEMGVHSVAYAFPRVKIITTAVDKKVNDLFRIIPGIGESLGVEMSSFRGIFGVSGPLPKEVKWLPAAAWPCFTLALFYPGPLPGLAAVRVVGSRCTLSTVRQP